MCKISLINVIDGFPCIYYHHSPINITWRVVGCIKTGGTGRCDSRKSRSCPEKRIIRSNGISYIPWIYHCVIIILNFPLIPVSVFTGKSVTSGWHIQTLHPVSVFTEIVKKYGVTISRGLCLQRKKNGNSRQ